jgi:hypothetical protein
MWLLCQQLWWETTIHGAPGVALASNRSWQVAELRAKLEDVLKSGADAAALELEVLIGLGRIVALYHHSSIS